MIGLNLLHLLTEARLAAFHAQVELLTEEDRASKYIAFPLKLERYLMEGSYNKVLAARSELPSAHFGAYMDRLSGTVRNSIAECAGEAYAQLSAAAAQKMMRFDTPAQLTAYGQQQGVRNCVLVSVCSLCFLLTPLFRSVSVCSGPSTAAASASAAATRRGRTSTRWR
jgi:hypothetical protein